MNLKVVAWMALCGAFAVACGDSGNGGSGGSSDGGGGSSSDGGSSDGGTANVGGEGSGNTINVGGGGTGGEPPVLNCDTGEEGDLNAPADTPEGEVCGDCIQCSFGDNCNDELVTFQQEPGCLPPQATPGDTANWYSCVYGNDMAKPATTGCPDDDPATADVNEFGECFDDCSAQFAPCGDHYNALLSCAVCVECPTNCNAAMYCGPAEG
ncbi:MAG: hypothetical protein HOW73_21540 [Polyangiaceae bacterium]|nr:hypothetical protein [Polyangiaceae bacterium]